MSLLGALKKYSLVIGMAAMALLVMGTVVEGGSPLQKTLFVIGAPVLGFTAWMNKQRMFVALQMVVTIGALLAFFAGVPESTRYSIIVGSGVAGIAYLVRTNWSREDALWPLGGSGLLLIAAGLSTDAVAHTMLFNSLLGTGGILVALYSAVGFFRLKVRIAAIWLVLNIIFSISPLMAVISQLLMP